MIAWLVGIAFGGTVTLEVGVLRDAGTVHDLVATGESGLCTAGPTAVSCPAEGPVRFQWGKATPWTLVGDVELSPGQTGRAWVLAREEDRVLERERLAATDLTEFTVRELFVRTGENTPPAPSEGMLQDLLGLLDHRDARVRRAAAEGLVPWTSGTANDPLPPGAPIPVPVGTLRKLAEDPDPGVRRRLMWVLRDLRPSHLTAEGRELVPKLLTDPKRSLQRTSMSALATLSTRDLTDPEEAWKRAMATAPRPDPVGRAACNTLAFLHGKVEPSDLVEPAEAVALVLAHHPERAWKVWTAWRKSVPFRRDWAVELLTHTIGYSPSLLSYWAKHEGQQLAAAIALWEPGPTHSDRWQLMKDRLVYVKNKDVRDAFGMPPLAETAPDPGPDEE